MSRPCVASSVRANRWSAPSVAGAWRIWPLTACASCSRGTGPLSACARCCQNYADSSSSGANVRCANTNVATSSASRCCAKRISLYFSVVQVLKLTPKGVSPPFSLTPPPQAVQEEGDLDSYLYSSIDDTKVLLTACEDGWREGEYSFVLC